MRSISRSLAARIFSPSAVLVLGLGGLCQGTPLLMAQHAPAHLAPAIARSGVSLGLESPTAPVSATVWLNLHDKAGFDAAVKQLYTPGSPTFHQWMTPAELKRYLPTAAEVAAVKAELAAHHLTVVSSDAANLSVKFKGQASDFESAFHTQLNRYQMKNQLVRALLSDPQLGGGADGLVSAVTGISGIGMRAYHSFPLDPDTGKQIGLHPVVAGAKPDGLFYSGACIYLPKTIKLTSPGVTATYSGIVYGANTGNTQPGTLPPCAYAPQDVYKIYHLDAVYGLGYAGQGTSVAIVDAFGSPTITYDAAYFSSLYNLPAITSTNFKIYQPGPPDSASASDLAGWASETTLDVEWAHAIAPQAKVNLVEAISDYDDDLQLGVLYAIINKLGNVISNSYGGPESFSDPATMTTWEEINEYAAAMGISVHYATGDDGDYAAFIDSYTGLYYTDVSSPASSPHATAIGGTSVAFSPIDGSILQTGWGNNITRLDYKTGVITDPPLAEGFVYGSGGGVSGMFAKPSYQAALPGPGRHLPDISAIADPYTGVEIIQTIDGLTYYEAIGGTSLATPVFSAMWALVSQYYGGIALGQAAPYIAADASLLTDVLATYDPFNVTGSITDSKGKTKYSSAELSQPLDGTTGYTGALFHGLSGAYYNLTFGTDSSLTVTPGWDDVTGYGTPDFGKLMFH